MKRQMTAIFDIDVDAFPLSSDEATDRRLEYLHGPATLERKRVRRQLVSLLDVVRQDLGPIADLPTLDLSGARNGASLKVIFLWCNRHKALLTYQLGRAHTWVNPPFRRAPEMSFVFKAGRRFGTFEPLKVV